ncbi:hypothetical protein [Streptococcus suis]|uniref:Bacteriophage transcriptional activator n=1 Tax=Streptococcus suis TaxID=1307 RepID=A0A9X4MN66_STRSU|nr:hypothetical protein [Streptococcus suis]AZR96638.1 hypothetical protein A7J10_01775 [Streptococcus suis]KPA63589.1 hypothetical protein XK27_11560 [Streptococcus suis]MBY4989939.1 hypothetical protein [Streptococcus suis]MDG4515620.1 hypothetical protein [Streptococcus suis]MDG4521919.1 hypothetical protein [Streptococcus suis]
MTTPKHVEATRNYLEYELEEKYLNIDKLIQKRKTDLLQGYEAKQMNMKRFDTSKIKSGSHLNHAENRAIEFSSDIVIQKLEEFQKCIDELFKKLEPDDRIIFELRWGHQKRDWDEIYHTMQLGKTGYLYKKKSSILKRREIILDSFAKLLYI